MPSTSKTKKNPRQPFLGLSIPMLNKLFINIAELHDKFQMTNDPDIKLACYPGNPDLSKPARKEVFDFLHQQCFGFYEDPSPSELIFHVLDPDKLEKTRLALSKAIRNTTKNQPPASIKGANLQSVGKDIVYEITYTSARQIFLNKLLLSTLVFDSENHVVFEYVNKHPKCTISLEEIEKSLRGRKLSKTLPKIVENWGFTGQLKKVFFDVSKLKIRFRNSISGKDLHDFDVEYLRLPRSANKAE